MPSRPTPAIARVALALVTMVATFALTTGAATAASMINEMTEVASANDGMGSGAIEWSGATWNSDRNVLLVVDDERNAYEFALDTGGAIDHSVDARLIELRLGAGDYEGVAWIEGETYAFLSEGAGVAIVATVPDAAIDGTTTVRMGDIERSFDAHNGSYQHNKGPEGLATDGESFYVATELPASLAKFDAEGNWVAEVDLPDLADATGVVVASDGSFLVTSHESRAIGHYDVDWDASTAVLLGMRDADLFTQLEGIAAVGDTELHLFGEDNTRKGNPGQTYSHLHRELPIEVFYYGADINCSGDITIADALMISQIQVGLAQPQAGCSNADVNGDGRVDIRDAILITQCQVGITNAACQS